MTPSAAIPEIFIGLVARLGVDNTSIVNTIEKILKEYGFQAIHIKVTDAVRELQGYDDIPRNPIIERYDKHISACNEIRQKTGMNDILSRLAVSRIQFERNNTIIDSKKFRGRAFIINQLKRPEEATLLRSLYGEHYFQISCHAKAQTREHRIAAQIAGDNPKKPKAVDWLVDAKQLVQRDEAEEENRWGQRVRDVFPTSDVVIDASTPKLIITQIDRVFRALFGDPRVTPTLEEYGMQLARTAALRSADLSRQVGASILNQFAEIQALGCNEVPKAGGGTYWEQDKNDAREFQLGRDSNDDRKVEVLLDLASRMLEAGMLKDKYQKPGMLKSELLDRADSLISDSQMMDSLEYGRTIHAEMNAITDAARGGHAIRGCTLYCNTFPCHNCAKHIVAAGIQRVVYLVPYPKSYAEDLFSDSVVVEPAVVVSDRVVFEQFIGIAGPMYGRVFEKRRWKDSSGAVPAFNKEEASFARKTPAPAYLDAEAILSQELGKDLDARGLAPRQPEKQK